MNLYVRYFDHETLATSLAEVEAFLSSLRDVKLNNDMLARVGSFMESDNVYPYRLKVSYTNYVLFLKTDARSLEEFKAQERQRKEQRMEGKMSMAEKKRSQLEMLNEPREGWYDGKIVFKRVVLNRETNKCMYVDTLFRAKLRAGSAMDCYNRLVEHLRNRQDVDPRSQFPSAKSANFEFRFLDEEAAKEAAPKADEPAAGNGQQVDDGAEEFAQ